MQVNTKEARILLGQVPPVNSGTARYSHQTHHLLNRDIVLGGALDLCIAEKFDGRVLVLDVFVPCLSVDHPLDVNRNCAATCLIVGRSCHR